MKIDQSIKKFSRAEKEKIIARPSLLSDECDFNFSNASLLRFKLT